MDTLVDIARLRMIVAKFQSATDWLVAKFDISPRRYQTLLLLRLHDEDGGLGIGEIGKAIGVKHNTCTELLNRMETDGLVRRERQLEDRRATKIFLTAEGRALVNKIAEADRERLAAVEQEMRTLLNTRL